MPGTTQGFFFWLKLCLLGDASTCVFFLVVEDGIKRESFDFVTHFIILLWSCHRAVIRSTILENKECNPYNTIYLCSHVVFLFKVNSINVVRNDSVLNNDKKLLMSSVKGRWKLFPSSHWSLILLMTVFIYSFSLIKVC